MLAKQLKTCDVAVGALSGAGGRTPIVVTEEMVSAMRPGTVIVDVSIDHGGCFETSHATTHNDPIYVVDDVIHYCVANMPGAVPMTSAQALNNAVLPYALALAQKGWKAALLADANLRNGLNICQGAVTHQNVAESLALPYTAQPQALAA